MPEQLVEAPEFVILGAGAMGTVFGAHLARAGHSVAMLVREHRAQQIRTDGLRLAGLEEISVRVPALTDASRLRRAGILIVAMKTLGTAAALAPLRHVQFDAVLSLQNGAFKNDLLVDVFGRERVLGALSDASGELRPDGSVLFTRNVMTLIGELEGEVVATAQVTWQRRLMYGAGLVCQVESVRVASRRRSAGLGAELMRWIIDDARRRDCARIELTSNAKRIDARRFYERLGFTASHVGMKLYLRKDLP